MDPTKQHVEFDALALWQAIDERRQVRNISWREVMDEINTASPLAPNVHPFSLSTVHNIKKRGSVGCQHAVALIRWLGRQPESFLSGRSAVPGKPLPVVPPDRKPRWDIQKLAEAVDIRRKEQGLTWGALAKEVGSSTSQVSGLRSRRYGIGMSLAMRLTQWLKRPATDFIIAADW